MKIVSRKQWGARPRRERTVQDPHRVKAIYVHYSESPGGQRRYPQQCAAVRGIQNFHMDSRGWSDIAYSYLVSNPYRGGASRAFEGRGIDTVPAAQMNHNTNTVAVCVICANGEKISWRTKLTLRRLIWTLRKQIGKQVPVRPHNSVNETSCPGAALTAWVKKTYRQT
jgi:hypothetical protein